VHLRDPKTHWFINLDEHPDYSHNPRGTRERVEPRPVETTPWVLAKGSHFHVDGAHQPSLAFVPYLFSGDYYYLEEMAFWAAHNMVSIHYQYRERDMGLLKADQTRGEAWTLRNLLHIAALAPDGSKEKDYFEAKLANNLEYYASVAEAENASPLGLYGETHAYTRGWPMKPVNWRSRYFSMPPWQHNFLAWAMAHCVDHGYADAVPFRDYLMRFPIGVVSHPQEITPHAGSEYYVFIGERLEDDSVKWCTTWREIADLTYKAPRPPGVAPKAPPTKTDGNYAGIMRGALICATRAKLPGAREAFEWVDAQYEHKDLMWAFEPPAGK
jgi:hypothetical protein